MRACHVALALGFLILTTSATGAAQTAEAESDASYALGADEAVRSVPVYWPAAVSFAIAATSALTGLSATLSADRQVEASARALKIAAARIPNDQMVCPLGSRSLTCREVSSRLADARRLDELAVAGYVVGGMAATVGMALVIWPLRIDRRGRWAAISPEAGPRGGRLGVVGAF